MRIFVRAAVSLLVFLAVYFFSFWLLYTQVIPDSMPWLMTVAALLTATAAGWLMWRHMGMVERGMLTTAVLWAAVVGAIGFCAGFFGSMIFAPEANQGPLLGIFITGPLGFIGGGVAGLIYAPCKKPKTQSPISPNSA